MPPLPGEERLLTLFADVHYYFQKPTNRPLRHRFDKASYFYLYYNSTRQTSRIEIANNPGTSEQDAVHGYIDKCRVSTTQRFPTRFSIEVEAEGIATSPTSPVTKDLDEWRLFSGDLRDSSQEKHKVHTLDVYLWAQEDARLALGFFGKLLTPAQLDVGDTLQNRHQESNPQHSVSSVVKNLESIAISDPAYQNGQTRDSQNNPQSIPVKLPPPPAPPGTSQSQRSARSQDSSTTVESTQRFTSSSLTKDSPAATYTPVAYNPAAPAAPEPIAHREKTPPPPEDGGGGPGLQHAAHDQGYHSGQSQYPHYGSPPPPPPSTSVPQSSAWGSPPPPSTLSGYTSQSSSLAHMTPPPNAQQHRSSGPSTAPSFAPPPSGIQYNDMAQKRSSAAETYAPAQPGYGKHEPETPNEQFYNTLSQDRRPLQHVQPKYQAEYFQPTGSAAYPQHTQSPPQHEYDIHSSVYRPTEAETGSHRHHRPSKSSLQKQDPGSFKGLAKRFTTGVNKAIQKAESKYP